MSLLYNKTIGEIAGNIIATIPTVQLAVNNRIKAGSKVIIAFIISGWSFEIIHANVEIEISEIRMIICSLSM